MNSKIRYKSHIGMYYASAFGQLFTFQLLGPDNKAHASVNFVGNHITDWLLTDRLKPRRAAIARLARIHYKKQREENESKNR